MLRIEYKKGFNRGYVWPNPPKNPTEFRISLHWGELCTRKHWWEFWKHNYHKHSYDYSDLCKSLFIMKGLEVIVVDEGIEYLCRISDIWRQQVAGCEVIVRAEVVE